MIRFRRLGIYWISKNDAPQGSGESVGKDVSATLEVSVAAGSGVLVDVLVGSGVEEGCGLGDGVGVFEGGST